LLDNKGIAPERVLYFSFDDPEMFVSQELQREIFDRLAAYVEEKGATKDVPFYFFLDEIQRLPRWELFLKKYYDLKFPARFIISGSASSPIFRSSQESLLGRIKDRHLLPFSFREYCLYNLNSDPKFQDALPKPEELRQLLLDEKLEDALKYLELLDNKLSLFRNQISQSVSAYTREGGFPEVWSIRDPIRKMEYLMEQQVRKVLYEDLMALTKYKKPENVLRFFVYLLAHPGIEINTARVAKEIGVERRIIEENLPRLAMTDLILRVQKFTHKPLRVKQGNIKCYPIDLALRNAVLKTWQDFTADPDMMGLYAENLVARQLSTWTEAIDISFYRERNTEVDFVVTHGGNKYLPIEVKHRQGKEMTSALKHFMKKFRLSVGLMVTRERQILLEDGILCVPLRYFLLAT
jgi:predicted AAA+ superfamily ATPase